MPFLVATISSGAAIRGQRTGHQQDRDRLLRQLAANARFADDNPNPVLRVSRAGVVEYANRASAPVMTAWNIAVGEVISQPIVADLRKAAEAPPHPGVKVQSGERTILVRPVAIDDLDVLLLYGTDATQQARQGL